MAWLKAIPMFLDLLTRAVEAIDYWIIEWKAGKRRDSVDKADQLGDQRPIEEAMGSDNAGKPTRHEIPDLKTRPSRNHPNND